MYDFSMLSDYEMVVTLGTPGVPSGGGSAGGGGATGGTSGGGGGAQQAADGGGGIGNQQGGPPPGAGMFDLLLPLLLGFFVLMIVMQIFAGRKQKKERESMLGSLKKHDVVQTTGGMIGTIMEVKDTEVVLRIDKEKDTRARFSKGAVTSVITSATA